jgi:PAS domain S-box-containing protein
MQANLDVNKSVRNRSSNQLRLIHLLRYAFAALSVGIAVGVSLLLQHFGFHVPAALLVLFAVAISSWYGGTGPAVLAAALSIISFYWYFVEPVRTIYIYRFDVPYFIIFAALAVLISWFGTVRRRAEKDVREQATLLSLTHDAVFVMDMDGVIKYWNRGAAQRYGWTAEEAVGKVAHDLLKTVFLGPLEQIRAEVIRTGRWEGELLHTQRDGIQVIVASRWALQRNERGTPVAILETNNDVTGRKRAEETLRRLNRELRAISNCNQSLLRATDEQTLLEEICRIICAEAGYRMAFVAYADHDEAKTLRPVAWTGAEEGYLASTGLTWADTERGRGPTGMAIWSGKTCCIHDFATDPRVAPWRESLLQRNLRSGIALPLKDGQANTFGSLTIHSAQPHAFTTEEIRLLEELAADLAFGIVTLRSRAARKEAEQQLTLLSFALDKVSEAAFLIDETGHFHYANEEGCRVLGYARAELLAMGVPDIDVDFPAGRWSDHWRDLKAQRSLHFESRHRTRDGRTFPVEISANYFEHAGRAYNLALVRDIAERKQAQEALQRTEAYLAEGQRMAHTGSWAFDVASDSYLYISEECSRIFEMDPKDGPPTREAISRVIHPEDWEKVQREFEKLLCEKVDTSSEFRIVLPSGTIRYIHAIRHPVLNDAGDVVRVVGTVIDITEHKKRDEALHESETRFRTFVDHAADAFFVVDDTEQGIIYDVNRQACESLGYTREELLGMSAPGLAYDPDAGMVQRIREGIAGGKVYTFELRHRRKDGTVFPIEVRVRLFELGGHRFHLATARDISERKRAEEERRQAAERFRAVADYTYDWENWIGVDGKLLWVNPAVERITGYSIEECMAMPDFPIPIVADADRRTVASQMREAVEGYSRNDFEFRVRHKDGRLAWVAASWQPIYDSQGARLGYRSSIRDIAERKRAEEALQRTAAYLAETQRLTRTGTFVAEATTKPLYWSEELFRIFGFDPKDGLPTRDQPPQRIHPEDLDKFWQAWQRAIHDKVDADVEYRIVLPDRTVKHVYGLVHAVLNANGEVTELVGSTVDITERKRAEEALRESETRFRTFVDHAADAFFLHDEHHKVLDVNRQACENLGYTREELIGMDPREFDRDIDAARLEWIGERLAAGEVCTFETRHRRKDGTVFPVELRVRPFSRGGRPLHLALARDITERKRAEEALRESETRFRTFVDHAADAFFMLSFEQGTIIDVNRNACESLGYTREELIGTTPLAFDVNSDASTFDFLAEPLAGENGSFDRHWHRRKDGSLFPVEVQTSEFWHGGRRFQLKVAHDISDRLRAEEEGQRLRQLEADLAHINRVSMLGELASSIAHEVNQPLSGVVSNASACLRWLAADPPNLEEARETARRITRDGKRAAEVVARIRALATRTAMPREELDLNDTISDVLVLVGDQAKRKNVIIRSDFADCLLPVSGDRVQLQQVVLNLVMNGIEAMSTVNERPRELVITTRNIDSGQVLVTVEDSGVGLDPNTTGKIFDPFYTTKPGGMGMGLCISRSILQAHGGQLAAVDKDGAGSIFRFTLPKYEEQPNTDAARA